MKRTRKIIGVLSSALIVLLVGVAMAAIYQTRTISNTVNVAGSWNFQTYNDAACAL